MAKRRNVMLEDALRDPDDPEIDVTEAEANAELPEAPAPPVVPVVAPSAPLSMSVADIQAIVRSAVEATQGGNAAIAEQITQGLAQARKPIPEGTDASYPRISNRNPLGERDHPTPPLKCAVFLGTQDAKTKVITRAYPFEVEDLTVYEVLAANLLEPGTFPVQLHDGSPITVSVVPEHDAATGALTRLVLVVPASVIGKGSAIKNMLPGMVSLSAQMTGHDVSKLKGEELAFVMAEHRAGRYVAGREKVAA